MQSSDFFSENYYPLKFLYKNAMLLGVMAHVIVPALTEAGKQLVLHCQHPVSKQEKNQINR